jgi:hypothetical protein
MDLELLIETRRLRQYGIALLKYLKEFHVEKMLNLFYQRSTAKVFSVYNLETDGRQIILYEFGYPFLVDTKYHECKGQHLSTSMPCS